MWTIKQLAAASGVAVCLASAPAEAFQNGCKLVINLDSADRQVDGPVNTECSGSLHGAPFGNWGVESPVSSRTNANQFAGWKHLDGNYHWNSCTDGYPPPSIYNYNYNDYTSQFTTMGDQTYGHGALKHTDLVSCLAYDGEVVTVGAHYALVYELDPFCCDEVVDFFGAPEQSLMLDCTATSCYGDSGSWVNLSYTPIPFTALVIIWSEATYGPL